MLTSYFHIELQFLLGRKMLASVLFELKRKLRLSDFLLCKIPLARKMPFYGNKVLRSKLSAFFCVQVAKN